MFTQKLVAIVMVFALTLPGCVAAHQQARNVPADGGMPLGDFMRTMQRISYGESLPEETPEAVAALERLLAGDPAFARTAALVASGEADPETRRRVASRFMEENIFHAALPIYERLREIPGYATESDRALTRIWMNWGDPESALPYAIAVTRIDPSFEAWDTLGRAYLRLNRSEDAIVALSRASELGDDPTTEANVGYAYLLEQEWDRAAMHLESALSLGADGEQVRNNLGIALARLGRSDEALEHFLAFSTPAAAYNNLGVVLMTGRKWNEARDAFSATVAADPQYPGAARNLARASGYIRPPAIVDLGPPRSTAIVELAEIRSSAAPASVREAEPTVREPRGHAAIVELRPLAAIRTPAVTVSAGNVVPAERSVAVPPAVPAPEPIAEVSALSGQSSSGQSSSGQSSAGQSSAGDVIEPEAIAAPEIAHSTATLAGPELPAQVSERPPAVVQLRALPVDDARVRPAVSEETGTSPSLAAGLGDPVPAAEPSALPDSESAVVPAVEGAVEAGNGTVEAGNGEDTRVRVSTGQDTRARVFTDDIAEAPEEQDPAEREAVTVIGDSADGARAATIITRRVIDTPSAADEGPIEKTRVVTSSPVETRREAVVAANTARNEPMTVARSVSRAPRAEAPSAAPARNVAASPPAAPDPAFDPETAPIGNDAQNTASVETSRRQESATGSGEAEPLARAVREDTVEAGDAFALEAVPGAGLRVDASGIASEDLDEAAEPATFAVGRADASIPAATASASLGRPVPVTLGYAAFWMLPLVFAGMGFRIQRFPGLLVGLVGGCIAGSALLAFLS